MAIHHRHVFKGARVGKIGFWTIYTLAVIFMLQSSMNSYINSSYMEQYVSTEGVGALFSIGSAIAVIAFLFFSHALRAVGNVRLTVYLALIDMVLLLILGITDSAAIAITTFVLLVVVKPLLYLNIDIFSETLIGSDESSTGSKRGLTLTLMSLAAVVSPLVMALILRDSNDPSPIYFASAGVLAIFILFILIQFRNFKDPLYKHLKVKSTLRSLWITRDIRNVLFTHFTLQMLFAWTVIYMPLYLFKEIGLQWDQIGYIIAVALTAYVILEWPLGVIADRFIGEKEIMALGFLILAVSVSYFAFLDTDAVIPWMVLMFVTRIGAAMAETTTESYFFKHTKGGDAHALSIFRLLRPLATIFGALIGSAALLYLPFNLVFVVFGFCMVPAIFFTIALKDTK